MCTVGAWFRCYDNIHVRKLIALYTANAYSNEREMSASACTRSKAGLLLLTSVIYQRVDVVLGGDYFTYTRHEPVGVCGQIIPASIIDVLCACDQLTC